MDFSGPQIAEFNNVRSLNLEFLNNLRTSPDAEALQQAFSPTLRPMVAGLTELQARRLAETPFLLLSLRERDDDYWSVLFADDPNRDIFAVGSGNGHDSRLAAAARVFVAASAAQSLRGPPCVGCDDNLVRTPGQLHVDASVATRSGSNGSPASKACGKSGVLAQVVRAWPELGARHSKSGTSGGLAVHVDDRSCGTVPRCPGCCVQNTTSRTSCRRKTRPVLTSGFCDDAPAGWVQ